MPVLVSGNTHESTAYRPRAVKVYHDYVVSGSDSGAEGADDVVPGYPSWVEAQHPSSTITCKLLRWGRSGQPSTLTLVYAVQDSQSDIGAGSDVLQMGD